MYGAAAVVAGADRQQLSACSCSLHDALWGAVVGYLALWSVFWLFKLITGKDGMGYGDFKLLAMLGAWGGWQILPLTILLSSMVGAIVGPDFAALAQRRKPRRRSPSVLIWPLPAGLPCSGVVK